MCVGTFSDTEYLFAYVGAAPSMKPKCQRTAEILNVKCREQTESRFQATDVNCGFRAFGAPTGHRSFTGRVQAATRRIFN